MDLNLPAAEEINTPKKKKKINRKKGWRNGKNSKVLTKETTDSLNLPSSVNHTNSTNIVNTENDIKQNGLSEEILKDNKKKKRRKWRKKKNINNKEQETNEKDLSDNKDIKCSVKKSDQVVKTSTENSGKCKQSRNIRPERIGGNTNGLTKINKKVKNSGNNFNIHQASGNIQKITTNLGIEDKKTLTETEISLEVAKNILNSNSLYFHISRNVIPELHCKQTCPICCEKFEFFGMLPFGESSCFLCRSPFKSLVFFRVGNEIPTIYPPININDCKRRYFSKSNINFQRRNDIIFGCSLTVIAFDTILQHYCWVCHINGTSCTFKTFHELERHYVIQHKRSFCSICVEYEQKLSMERIPFTSKELKMHLDGKLTPFENLVTNDHAKCTFCPLKTFYNSENLFRHYRLQHQTCEICYRENNQFLVFDIHEDLLKHYENEHFPCPIKNCKINGICFSSEIELQLHLVEVHNTTKKRRTLPLHITSENDKNGKKKNDNRQNNINFSNGFLMDQFSFPSLLSNSIEPLTVSTNDGPSFASIAARPPPVVEEPSIVREKVENIITSVSVNHFENGQSNNPIIVKENENDMENVNHKDSVLSNNEKTIETYLLQDTDDLVESKINLNENDTIIQINAQHYIGEEQNNGENNKKCTVIARKNIFWRVIKFILSPLTSLQRAILFLVASINDFFIHPN